MNSKVIVIGGDHYNTLGVIRSLGEKGIKTYLIIMGENSYVSKSKYVSKTWLSNNDNEIIKILLNEFNNDENKPIIITTSDSAVKLIDNNLNELKDKYIVSSANEIEGNISRLMNKKLMAEMALDSGLLVPKSWDIYLNRNEIESSIHKDIIFPCIVKPMDSTEGKKLDAVICYDSLELADNLSKLSNRYTRRLVQEYINKESEFEVIGCVPKGGKNTVLPGIIVKDREYPIKCGSISYAKLLKEHKDFDINLIDKFLKKINYVGLFDIEFIYYNEKFYFIEINFRNGADSYAYTKAGVNIPYTWCMESLDNDLSGEDKKISKDINFMMEVRDIRHVFNGNLNFIKWIKDLLKTKAFLIFNIEDIKPAIAFIFQKLKS
ncbi:hypothetical protein [[Clostridium] dakarense]|uniref:hypothetical protein n=1 Tax=Faecalimicrobium dakarense TaxID=1301100 RepID=UPI0004BC1539|nr:hypothetical protein [[Clostridium] dakarense]